MMKGNNNNMMILKNSKMITGYGLYQNEPLKHDDYIYPMWATVLGWSIAGSSIAMIPAVAIYQIIITPGTFCEVSTKPSRSPAEANHSCGLDSKMK